MNDLTIVIPPFVVTNSGAKIHIVGPHGNRFLEKLRESKIEKEAASVLKAFIANGGGREWDIRPYFDGKAWDREAIEVHLAEGLGLLDEAIDVWLASPTDYQTTKSFANHWARIQDRLRERYPWCGEFAQWPAQGFPAYDAALTRIPKKRPGEFRVIAVPTGEQKHAARGMLPTLDKWVDYSLPIHGFVRGRNAVTNAKTHIGYGWSLCFDLEDFFDHVTVEKLVRAGLPLSIARAITDRGGVARQGYPTSPCAANIAFQVVDRALLEELRKLEEKVVYTRYADDLSFSANSEETLNQVKRMVEDLIPDFSFKISVRKTHRWSGKAGRRVITGVAVGEKDIRAPRNIRRRLRAARHQRRLPQITGLAEWSKLKEPATTTKIV